MEYGFIRVASAVPVLRVADCSGNAEKIISLIQRAAGKQVELIVFPELSITGCSCGDLFFYDTLLDSASSALAGIAATTASLDIVSLVGLPLRWKGHIYSCAAVLYKGEVLGIVPRASLEGEGDYARWFTEGSGEMQLYTDARWKNAVPWGTDLLFAAGKMNFGIVIGEDFLRVNPKSSFLSLNGADLVLDMASSSECVGKTAFLDKTLSVHSEITASACLYVSSGFGESSTDAVYSGMASLYECGRKLFCSERFGKEAAVEYSEIDIDRIRFKHRKKNIGKQAVAACQTVPLSIAFSAAGALVRKFDKNPFLPTGADIPSRCREIMSIQVSGLMKRMLHTRMKKVVIGISGGLDSTLALLVAVTAFDRLGYERKGIVGVTMPGFGTTGRTYENALELMDLLGTDIREVSIKDACRLHFKDIGHNMENHDVTYENGQARERTQILMDIANMEGGLVIGTGDLSELALGWATYNGDHMSMYGVNGGVPKTVVKNTVSWYAASVADSRVASILQDVVATPISPELIPADESGNICQKTENLVGPYELHDFYLYYFMNTGCSPEKIYYIAKIAFKDIYDNRTLLKWLRNFFRRFFNQQFKRNCLPDCPKVGSVALGSREDWRMPSDAESVSWMERIDALSE